MSTRALSAVEQRLGAPHDGTKQRLEIGNQLQPMLADDPKSIKDGGSMGWNGRLATTNDAPAYIKQFQIIIQSDEQDAFV